MHRDAARAGVFIRKCSSCGGAPRPVHSVAADAGLAGRDAAGRAGLLGHELLNKFLESSIHNYHPLSCCGPCGDLPAHQFADRGESGSGAGQRDTITPQSARDRNKLQAAHCMNTAGRDAQSQVTEGAPSSYFTCCSPAVGIVAGMTATGVTGVVVMVQENHTTDNYLRGLAPYGVNVATDWSIQPNPPASDQPHDRHAYYRWLSGQHSATHTQFDTDTVLSYYAYLAKILMPLTGAIGVAGTTTSPLPTSNTPPTGSKLAYGPRVPLLMFGGPVAPRIDSRCCSHVSVPKTALQLLGLPALGISRLDDDPGLADLVDVTHRRPPPPPPGSPITLPAPPRPARPPQPLPAPPPGTPQPVGPIRLRNGETLPPRTTHPSRSQHRTLPPGSAPAGDPNRCAPARGAGRGSR